LLTLNKKGTINNEKIKTMELSSSADKLRKLIEKAIEDHKITRDEYDQIIHLATEDGHIDSQEQALLSELQDMIESKMVRFVAS
jgi:regulatory protein YycI of two-component signal transduction system YycFG